MDNNVTVTANFPLPQGFFRSPFPTDFGVPYCLESSGEQNKIQDMEMVDNSVGRAQQRANDIEALRERIKLFDEWIEDLAEDSRRTESLAVSAEVKAATLTTIAAHIQKMKHARATAMIELAKKQGDVN
jgi:hypothetical protein